jgi:glycine cleavage system protein P-like pyridoxal-binding family
MPISDLRSAKSLTDFLVTYPRAMALSDQDPGEVFDRFHAPDAVYVSDGLRLDRARVVDHARPARKNVRDCHVDVHRVVHGGGEAAAQYSLTARMRKGRTVTTHVTMFVRFSGDGRIAHVDQETRTDTAAA